jgi:hypothetical protein
MQCAVRLARIVGTLEIVFRARRGPVAGGMLTS